MTEIPDDVMKAAVELVTGSPMSIDDPSYFVAMDVVARAILAERERCAAFVLAHQTIIAGEPADPMMPDIIDQMLRHPTSE